MKDITTELQKWEILQGVFSSVEIIPTKYGPREMINILTVQGGRSVFRTATMAALNSDLIGRTIRLERKINEDGKSHIRVYLCEDVEDDPFEEDEEEKWAPS